MNTIPAEISTNGQESGNAKKKFEEVFLFSLFIELHQIQLECWF